MTKEERVQTAIDLFREGYNCSQAVVAAYADLYGFTREQALRMAASFGGGIGRMHETCGAACGMFLLAGLERSAVSGADKERKAANYALVQELAERFRQENGALRCADLLGMPGANISGQGSESRPPKSHVKRPCVKMVESGARIFGDFLETEGKL